MGLDSVNMPEVGKKYNSNQYNDVGTNSVVNKPENDDIWSKKNVVPDLSHVSVWTAAGGGQW